MMIPAGPRFVQRRKRDDIMVKITDIRAIAKRHGINSVGAGKAELVRAIQQAEGNFDCFGTERFQWCGEESCYWRIDCESIPEDAPKKKVASKAAPKKVKVFVAKPKVASKVAPKVAAPSTKAVRARKSS